MNMPISGEQVYQALLRVRQENCYEFTHSCNFLSIIEIDGPTLTMLIRHDTMGRKHIECAVRRAFEKKIDFSWNRPLPHYDVVVTFAV